LAHHHHAARCHRNCDRRGDNRDHQDSKHEQREQTGNRNERSRLEDPHQAETM